MIVSSRMLGRLAMAGVVLLVIPTSSVDPARADTGAPPTVTRITLVAPQSGVLEGVMGEAITMAVDVTDEDSSWVRVAMTYRNVDAHVGEDEGITDTISWYGDGEIKQGRVTLSPEAWVYDALLSGTYQLDRLDVTDRINRTTTYGADFDGAPTFEVENHHPYDLEGSAVGDQSVRVSWRAGLERANDPVDHYVVQARPGMYGCGEYGSGLEIDNTGIPTRSVTVAPDQTAATVNNVRNGLMHLFSVVAVTRSGAEFEQVWTNRGEATACSMSRFIADPRVTVSEPPNNSTLPVMHLKVRLSHPSMSPMAIQGRVNWGVVTEDDVLDVPPDDMLVYFQPGLTVRDYTMFVLQDKETPEPPEEVSLTLADGQAARGTIRDTPPGPSTPPARLSIGSAPAAARATNVAVFPVRLTGKTNRTVTVSYRTKDLTAHAGRDYRRRVGTLTFRPGQRVRYVRVPVLRRGHWHGVRRYVLQLHHPKGARLATARGVGRIRR